MHRESVFRAVLLLFLLYFLCGVLLTQKRFMVDDRAVLALNGAILPDGHAGAATFSDYGSVLDWLEGSVVAQAWGERRCGDTICDAPEEFPAWGR